MKPVSYLYDEACVVPERLSVIPDRKLPPVCKNLSDQKPEETPPPPQQPFVSQPLSRTLAIELLDKVSNSDQTPYQEHQDEDETDAEVVSVPQRIPSGNTRGGKTLSELTFDQMTFDPPLRKETEAHHEELDSDRFLDCVEELYYTARSHLKLQVEDEDNSAGPGLEPGLGPGSGSVSGPKLGLGPRPGPGNQ
ncbi:mitogen-activated protein kinase kinase kinase kinase 3-like [Cottoperca gobio]|uniref:Mitogen-activated protein kinase kinase kinase kinase 3-like n=1 Tax=Cottoperca gobio TaxID=56716 RepID=A0A6J2PDT9_COTGO|nr:mitogen-activated protein kinase kinase kinase kinase 3-like [Cottoperca gobio]